MRAIRAATAALTIVMAFTIIAGLIAGDFGDEGSDIIGLAWGRVTLIDLYVGLALFGGWIIIRDGGAAALPWLIALVILGNLAAAAYALKASLQSTSVSQFLTGSAE
ncbi:MAG: hypothetical protein HKN80_07580 [Acidimicrobiia bacterium]|nr:hypothetical protein [Acidimicrobiia bacterium]